MSAWNNIKAIMKRELGSYFSSPIAYVFLVIFLLLAGTEGFTTSTLGVVATCVTGAKSLIGSYGIDL